MELSYDEIKLFIEKPFAFVERMGIQALELKPGYVKLAAPLEGNGNHIGSMYAGALFTLAEMPAGALYLTTFDVTRYYPIVKEVHIRFRRPARTDITAAISMTAEQAREIQKVVEQEGKADFTLEIELLDAGGTVVAVGKGVYQLRPMAEISV